MKGKNVKGTFCLDYVKIIKKSKHIDWSKYLEPQDLAILDQRILSSQWYPLDSFIRMGLAVFKELVGGNLDTARGGGKIFMDQMADIYQNLVRDGDPMRSLDTFRIIRNRFFDFEGLEIERLGDNMVHIYVNLGFGHEGDEPYSHHLVGAFERLLELSRAEDIEVSLLEKSWDGAERTIIAAKWS